jgi:hypothetical protein
MPDTEQTLRLTGESETDAERITEFSNAVRSKAQRRRELFRRLTQTYTDFTEAKRALDGAVDQGAEIFTSPTKAAYHATDTPFEDVLSQRSRTANIADKSTTARTKTTDFEEWASAPSQLDYPGVDTLSERYRAQRIQQSLDTARDRGIVRDVDVRPELYGGMAGGEFNPTNRDILLATDPDAPHRNLVHEIGHAIDLEAGTPETETYASEGIFAGLDEDSRETVTEELLQISRERRPTGVTLDPEYNEDPRELAADFAALAIEDPAQLRKVASTATEVFDDAGVLELFTGKAAVGGSGVPLDPPDREIQRELGFTLEQNRADIFEDGLNTGPTEKYL